MSKFRINQRVRLLRGSRVKPGTTGTVSGPLEFVQTENVPGGEWCHAVQYDGYHSPHMSGYYWTATDEMEPLYDGDTKISWAECVWKPVRIAA